MIGIALCCLQHVLQANPGDNPNRCMKPYYTCAVDTATTEKVFDGIKTFLIMDNLKTYIK